MSGGVPSLYGRAFYPLYGLKAVESPGAQLFPPSGWPNQSVNYGAVTDFVHAYHLSKREWFALTPPEAHAQARSWSRPFPLDADHLHFPVCLCVKGDTSTPRGRWICDEAARDAVLALRLLKGGWFLTPTLSEHLYPEATCVVRAQGPYRLAFMDQDRNPVHGLLFPRYELRSSELVQAPAKLPVAARLRALFRWGDSPDHSGTKAGDARPDVPHEAVSLARIGRVLNVLRRVGTNSAAEIAIENFNRSHGYQLSAGQCASLLFVALDAMLAGMSSRSIRKTRLALPFRVRLETALRAAGSCDGSERASWVDVECRGIRNALAHGPVVAIDRAAADIIGPLQEVIRILLLQYLRVSLWWRVDRDALTAMVGDTAAVSCVATYNRLLEQLSQGDSEGRIAVLLTQIPEGERNPL